MEPLAVKGAVLLWDEIGIFLVSDHIACPTEHIVWQPIISHGNQHPPRQ